MNRVKKNIFTSFFSILFTLFSFNLIALEGYEHRKISDTALLIAVEYFCYKNPNDCNAIKKEAAKLYSGKAKPDFTYGKTSEIVDYMSSPIQIFLGQKSANTPYAKSIADLNQYNIELLDNHEDELTFDFISASSQNERAIFKVTY